MKAIAVLGGGHGARTVAADLALAGHEVRLFERERFHANVAAIFEHGEMTISGKARHGTARLALATHDISAAISGVDAILIVVPALYHLTYAELLAPYLSHGQHVVLIPGTFGSLEFMTAIHTRGCRAEITASELDTLPYATRIDGPAPSTSTMPCQALAWASSRPDRPRPCWRSCGTCTTGAARCAPTAMCSRPAWLAATRSSTHWACS